MRREEAAIREYMGNLIEPASNWPEYYFKQRSYSRWAVNEILERIKNDRSSTPIEITEKFSSVMDDFSCYSDKSRAIFSAAQNTANDILDIFRAMY